MSVHSEGAKLASDFAKDICENEKVEKWVSGVAGAIVGTTVGALTANPAIGVAAGAATSGFARSHSKEVAQAVTTVGVAVAVSAASVLFVPGLVVYGIYSWIKGK